MLKLHPSLDADPFPYMLELQHPDSVWTRIPILDYPIPVASAWAIVGAVIAALISMAGSLAIAYFVYRLARNQFRSNRWWERQERRYTAVANELLTIKNAAAKLALYDYPDMEDSDITVVYSHEEKEGFRREIREAQLVVKKEIQRGLFLLSPRAIEVLRGYIRQTEDRYDHQYPDARALLLIETTYEDFTDLAQRDLGAPGLWWAHRQAGLAAVRSELARLWSPWTPELFTLIVGLHQSQWRLWYRRRKGLAAPGRPRGPFFTRAKKWLIANFSTRH